MSFLRTLLMFVFVFSLVGIGESKAYVKFFEEKLCIQAHMAYQGLKNVHKIVKENNKYAVEIAYGSDFDKLKELVKRNIDCTEYLANLPVDKTFTLSKLKKNIIDWQSYGYFLPDKNKITSNQSKEPSKRPLKKYSDADVCSYATEFDYSVDTAGSNDPEVSLIIWNTRKNNWVNEAKYRGLDCGVKDNNKTFIVSKPENTKPSLSSAELEKEKQKRILLQKKADEEERKRKALEKEIAELKKKNKELQQPKKQQKAKPKSGSGSGFFISKLGHIITNQHVVNKCKKITIGDHIDKQVPAKLLDTDNVNDLALLRTTNLKMASTETQSLLRKLSIEIIPLASGGLMRKSEVKGGEDVIVAGFPYGVRFGTDIKVTFGNVNSTKGIGDDSTQFQIQAPVQPGNSGGPIYDRYGNIVGVVVSQLNKFKLAKSIGSLPENVNFGIKASTVRQFLNTSGVITNYSKRTKPVSNEKMFELASKQTVMVVCHR